MMGNSDYDGFFRQFNRDYIVRELFQDQSFCTAIASFSHF